ncbi:fumarate hydratase C-terminal domain-containing protein [Candidatus Aerophobetes bacterium]|nr:fumarate hydratase C-terminal domain-containing protein [Candidatus Aerophobetes bacterium]
MQNVQLMAPVTSNLTDLMIGDIVHISGTILTARDMAHLRMKEYLSERKQLPLEFKGAVIFHAGPVVEKVDEKYILRVIGPTTSIRMEPYTRMLGDIGVKAIIGKGGMGEDTLAALQRIGGIYLQAPPGCAVKLAEGVKSIKQVHWLDLGVPEAIWVLEAKCFGPLIVGMDSQGKSLYQEVKEKALKKMQDMFIKTVN